MKERQSESDFSLRILWSFARWIEDQKGSEALASVAAAGGVSPQDFDGSTRWVSHAQLEQMLAAGLELAGDEETFKTLFAYRFEEGFGAFRLMVWAVSLQRMCQLVASMSNKVLTNVGHFETLYSTRTTFGVRYTSSRPESRLLCLSRQMAWSTSPTLRGLPRAEVVERACIANGDPCCEYHLRWFEERAFAPALVGLGGGALVAAAAFWMDPSYLATVALPMLGASLGYLREQRRVGRVNVAQAHRLGVAMRSLGEAEAETRSEIVALQQRQQEWSRRMEQQANERNATLERVVEGLDGLQQSRVSSLRGFSHDLRNPLFAVRANTELLTERIAEGVLQGDEGEILQDMDAASQQIEAMLGKLMELATAENSLIELAPHPVEVGPLADTLRRRLRALVHGKSIEVSVVCRADAPGVIVIDPLVFDRVVDNLLTNAAKYTDRGSIQLELSGVTGPRDGDRCLTLELTDTGRGIPENRIAAIFRPRPASEPKGPNSYGIGLSSAVALLGQIGGRLEVSSQPGVGSTFAAFFPVSPPEAKRGAGDAGDGLEKLTARVVKVRRAA